MSYARFGADGSDVYLYADATLGGVTCCSCALQVKASGLSTDEVLAHLREHRAAGHHVDAEAVAEIEADRAENDAAIRKGVGR